MSQQTDEQAVKQVDAIVIGGSAGALDVLATLLPALPAGCPFPVVVVLHVPAVRPSHLCEVLATRTTLPVREIEDKEPALAGTVYVAPPAYHALVERGRTFALSADALVHFSRPSIDVLFESAADAFGARLAGVVLTGANEDGARGLAAIARAGGLCLVQDPVTAAVRTMPDAALAAAAGARSLPAAELAAMLAALAHDGGRARAKELS
jgi:two-component system chemotaxis response regulator CheB